MKIGICGAQSTGKTTLLNALRSEDYFKGYHFGVGVTRRVKEEYGLEINEGASDMTQKVIMHEHFANLINYDDLITDRTTLDCYVYTMYLHQHGQVTDRTLGWIDMSCHRTLSFYDKLFYLKPEFPIEDDGTRSTSLTFQRDIAQLFELIISTNNIPVIHVTGSVRQRVQTILDHMEK